MFRSILQDIRQEFSYGNAITRLALFNVGVFVLINLVRIILFGVNGGAVPEAYGILIRHLALPSDPSLLIMRPWTLITHMFLHEGFWHLLWNMLSLYWFGRITGDFLGNRVVLPLYLFGGLSGSLFYLLSANLLPWMQGQVYYAQGASAAVMAMLFSSATLSPDYIFRLLLLGDVKLKYIAAALLFLDLIGLAGNYNTGGHFAHIGGALFGMLYVFQLRKGINLLDPLERLFAWKGANPPKRSTRAAISARKRPVKLLLPGMRTDDPLYSREDMSEQEILDTILVKIKQKGMSSLSDSEKEFLRQMSKNP